MDMRTPYVTAVGISRVLYNLGFSPRHHRNQESGFSGYWCSQVKGNRETVTVSYRINADQDGWTESNRESNKLHMISEYATELRSKGYVVENHGTYLNVSKPKKD